MTTPDAARRLALSLPEAIEQPHHGFPSYRVRGKIFATQPDDHHLNIMLVEQAIQEAVLLAPEACTEQWWGKKLTAVRVSLPDIAEDALLALLTEAWQRKRSKG